MQKDCDTGATGEKKVGLLLLPSSGVQLTSPCHSPGLFFPLIPEPMPQKKSHLRQPHVDPNVAWGDGNNVPQMVIWQLHVGKSLPI